jgi:uracil DNA glycosylase
MICLCAAHPSPMMSAESFVMRPPFKSAYLTVHVSAHSLTLFLIAHVFPHLS